MRDRELLTAPDAERVEAAWASVMHRSADLLPFFADTNLDVSATSIAKALGLRRADVLGRRLTKRRLPPIRALRNWIYVVQLAEQRATGVSLSRWAMTRGNYAAMYYRLVEDTTGQQWQCLRSLAVVQVKRLALDAWAPYLSESERMREGV